MSSRLRVAVFVCAFVISMIELAAGIAPGDEEPLCRTLRVDRAAPIPNYTPNMTVLMDSWNYQNLLPERPGSVWEQVDNDTNNNDQLTTNVSCVFACIYYQERMNGKERPTVC